MRLTAEQTETLPFPVGCLVWYDFQNAEASHDEATHPSIELKQGVVESVTFDRRSMSMMYEVVHCYTDSFQRKGRIVEEVCEQDLAYGANCPVIIDNSESGIVLLSEMTPSSLPCKFVYTVMISLGGSQARYEAGVTASRIKHRKVTKEGFDGAATAAAIDNDQPKDSPSIRPALLTPALLTAHVVAAAAVPTSIICDEKTSRVVTDIKKKRDHEEISSSLTTTPMNSDRFDAFRSTTTNSLHLQDSRRSFNNCNIDGPINNSGVDNNGDIVLTVPAWIQQNHPSQRHLFFNLIKQGRRTIVDVKRELGCKVTVNCPDLDRSGDRRIPMTITICCLVPWSPLNEHGHWGYTRVGGPVNPTACSISELEIHDLLRTRTECRKSHDFCNADRIWGVLRRAGVFVDDAARQWRADGLAIKRIDVGQPMFMSALQKVDELLSGYLDYVGDPGAKGRMTYEVAARCPGPHRPTDSTSNAVGWNSPNGYVFLSLIELPLGYTYGSEGLRTKLLSVASHLGCFVKIYGDVKHCDPYVLVHGKTWGNVDEAVEIVRDSIEGHSISNNDVAEAETSVAPTVLSIGQKKRKRNKRNAELAAAAAAAAEQCEQNEQSNHDIKQVQVAQLTASNESPEIVCSSKYSRRVPLHVEGFPPSYLIGLLLGHQGAKLRSIESRFGCQIEIRGTGSPRGLSCDDEPTYVYITGFDPLAIDAAAKIIESFIEHRKLRRVPIPVKEYPKIIGYIVGKQGRTLKDIENRTGCTIQLRGKGTRFFDNNPATVFISGDSSEAVDAASMMVESLIVEYAPDHCNKLSADTNGMKIEVKDPRDEDSACWL